MGTLRTRYLVKDPSILRVIDVCRKEGLSAKEIRTALRLTKQTYYNYLADLEQVEALKAQREATTAEGAPDPLDLPDDE